jgi:hypothetical protein
MIDWYDKNQCHHNDANGHDRSNGRVFKIVYGEPKPVTVDLRSMSDATGGAANAPNDWYVRHARRLLQERSVAGKLDREAVHAGLHKVLAANEDVGRRLQALWGAARHGRNHGRNDDSQAPRRSGRRRAGVGSADGVRIEGAGESDS